MLPLIFLPDTRVLLAGRGAAFEKRHNLLRSAGLTALRIVEGMVEEAALDRICLVFGAGLSPDESEALAAAARSRNIPVNIEDVPHLCDMHVPALVRRGSLLLTVSTGGSAPVLASQLRAWLESAFGPEWADRLEEAAALRAKLRAAGAPPGEVIEQVRAHVEEAKWLPQSAHVKILEEHKGQR